MKECHHKYAQQKHEAHSMIVARSAESGVPGVGTLAQSQSQAKKRTQVQESVSDFNPESEWGDF